MNKVLLLGRLTRDPEIQHTQSEKPMAVAKYNLAVNRRFKREGQQSADFINCVAFGKQAELVKKYLNKGMQVSIVGHIQTGSYTDKDGRKVYTTDVIVDEHYFIGNKKDNEQDSGTNNTSTSGNEFVPVDDNDDDLPF